MSRSISIVLKTAERCNISCRYCYFFFAGDDSYAQHPKIISRSTLMRVCEFLKEGIEALKLDQLHIVFHGGEPLLQPKEDFAYACELFTQKLRHQVLQFSLSIQTNGLLMSDAWVESFAKYNVRVGISLDGPRWLNDRWRIDYKRRGTYDRAVRGLQLLQRAARAGRLKEPPGILCVIDPTVSGREVFAHFVDELGVCAMDFLLPDANPDSAPAQPPGAYGKYLCEVFEAWCERGLEAVEVKFFGALLHRFDGQVSYLFDHAHGDSNDLLEAVTIASDGSLWPDDSMRSTAFWRTVSPSSVWDSSLAEVIYSEPMQALRQNRQRVPAGCSKCIWQHLCGGGFLQNRWSIRGGGNNPSVYCVDLQAIFLLVATYLARRGYSYSDFRRALGGH